MSGPGNGQPTRYEVTLAADVKEEVRREHERARARGQGQQFIGALRFLYDRLRKDPRVVGDPLYRLPALKLTVYHVVVGGLVVVHYAVHDHQPLVLLKGCQLLR